MGVVLVCAALCGLGIAAVVRWGSMPFAGPPHVNGDEGPSAADVARRYLWFVAVTTAAGLASGVVMAGPGGRLAMRLLAATAGDGAQGKITEAEEIVGEITVEGSIGFVIFVGLGAGLLTAAIYLLIRRWLPGGRLGGLALGALMLVAFAPMSDPLRKGNEDFDIVGPGWLAIAVFVVLGLAQGMVVAAVATRYGNALPLLSKERGVLVRYAPLVLLIPLVTPLLVVALVGVIVVAVSRGTDLGAVLRRPATVRAGRVILLLVALVALPRFVSAVVDIAGRGPS